MGHITSWRKVQELSPHLPLVPQSGSSLEEILTFLAAQVGVDWVCTCVHHNGVRLHYLCLSSANAVWCE